MVPRINRSTFNFRVKHKVDILERVRQPARPCPALPQVSTCPLSSSSLAGRVQLAWIAEHVHPLLQPLPARAVLTSE